MKEKNVFPLAVEQWRIRQEMNIIGACLEFDVCHHVIDILNPINFIGYTMAESETGNRISHGETWRAIQATFKNQPVTIGSVTGTMLPNYSEFPDLVYAISLLTYDVAEVYNIKRNALILVELSIREKAIILIERWIDDATGDLLLDLQGLSVELRKLDSDVFNDIEWGVRFLIENGHHEESDELNKLIELSAKRIIQMKKQAYRTYITQEYNRLNAETDGE